MATAAERGCFTLTWETENFSVIFSRNNTTELECPYFKTIFSEGSKWSTISLYYLQNFLQNFIKFKSDILPFLETFTVSILSSRGDVPVPANTHYTISKNAILGINSKCLLHDDTLTICFKLQQANIETGQLRIRTVLLKDNFTWNIKDFQSCRTFYSDTFKKENLLLYLRLESNNSDKKTHTFQVEALHNIGGCISLVYFKPSITVQQGRVLANSSSMSKATQRWQMEIFPRTITTFQLHMDAIYAIHKEVCDIPSSPRCAPRGSVNEVVTKSSDSLNGDLLHLYRTALLSDATIQTEGRSFPVHKNILSIRSEVFRAMFERDQMKEGRSGVVDIDDVDSETVDRMLVFLYGDSLDDIQWEEAAALYYAADKYAVHTLKQKCADILNSKLSVANVCDALVLADQHSDQDLMKCTVNFILDHKEVISSPDWEKLEESNSRLTSKVTKEILLKKWGN